MKVESVSKKDVFKLLTENKKVYRINVNNEYTECLNYRTIEQIFEEIENDFNLFFTITAGY